MCCKRPAQGGRTLAWPRVGQRHVLPGQWPGVQCGIAFAPHSAIGPHAAAHKGQNRPQSCVTSSPLSAVTDKWFSQRVAPRARNPTGYFTVNALRLLRKFVSKNKIRLKIFQSKTMSTLILICLILGQSENKRLFFSSFGTNFSNTATDKHPDCLLKNFTNENIHLFTITRTKSSFQATHIGHSRRNCKHDGRYAKLWQWR